MDAVKANIPQQTCLHAAHLKASARMVDFAGWHMPLHYGSQISEHHAVRKRAGVFDVSHMGIVDVAGPDALAYLRYLLAGDVARLTIGAGLYCCLLNPEGGIKDDLIVYRLGESTFRLVINAGTRQKDIDWFHSQKKSSDITLTERTDLAMLALQGPDAPNMLPMVFPPSTHPSIATLQPFHTVSFGDWTIARTGYTGEEGYEIMLPTERAAEFWHQLLKAKVTPCGLGARDTLRLEAGLNLYGADMDETITPLESGLAWTVHLDVPERDFIGKTALMTQQKQGLTQKRVGLLADPRTILRNNQRIQTTEGGSGIITSGGFSPTLGIGIALARVPIATQSSCTVTIRGKPVPVRIIRPPFVRYGQPCFKESAS